MNWVAREVRAQAEQVVEANEAALEAGFNAFGDHRRGCSRASTTDRRARPAELPTGRVHQHHWQHGHWPWGLIAASRRPACRAFSAPTRSPRPRRSSKSSRRHKNFGVQDASRPRTRSPPSAALGAAFAATLGVMTSTSGPGHGAQGRDAGARSISSSSCRWSSSTSSAADRRPGLPTKVEQSDLLLWYGLRPSRRGAHCRSSRDQSPSDCVRCCVRGGRIACKYMTPVILLSDGYIANGIRAVAPPRRRCTSGHPSPLRLGDALDEGRPDLPGPTIRRRVHTRSPVGDPRHRRASSTASAASRRSHRTGNISYDPDNHETP